MSNAINRQAISDYDKRIGAWRKLAETYNSDVAAYNASVEDFNSAIRTPRYAQHSENVYNPIPTQPAYNEFGPAPQPLPNAFRKGEAGVEGSFAVPTNEVDALGNTIPGVEWRPIADANMPVYAGQASGTVRDIQFDADGKPYITRTWTGERIFPARPGAQPVEPDKPPSVPTMTVQQGKNLSASDSPLADAEKAEVSKRSPFRQEEGLVARAMKGFK